MKKVKIYCLYDPTKCKVRYIGRTTKEVLDHRLIEHITKAKYYNRYHPGKKATHKVNWINDLLKRGIEPKIKKLTEVEGWKESHIFEQKLIKKYCLNRQLTNADDRGQGNVNKIISEEQKIQISNSLKDYYKTNINPRAKCIEVYDLDGNYKNSYNSASEFADIIKVAPRRVTQAATGKKGRVLDYQIKYCIDSKIIGEYKKLTRWIRS